MKLSSVMPTFGVALLTVMTIPAAVAGCGDVSKLQPPYDFVLPTFDAPVSGDLAAAMANANNFNAVSLTGTWSFQLIAKGNTTHTPNLPDGAVVDFGYQQFHSDGNEMMNSGGRAPATENFCMGVWQRTGQSTYQVNHFALSYDSGTGALNARVNIQETITLSAGGSKYSGTFTIDVYAATGTAKLDHVEGTITGTRITLDSTLP